MFYYTFFLAPIYSSGKLPVMAYNITPLTSSEWLNILNQEAHPDLEHHTINYYKLGDGYVVHLRTGVGNFVSNSFVKEGATTEDIEEFFDKATKELEETYQQKKAAAKSYTGFSLASFG
jgi:hypothetical protein